MATRFWNLTLFACLFMLLPNVMADKLAPETILKKCIDRHGGSAKFKAVKDIYVKMDIRSYSDRGEIESQVHQYFRLPDKLRAEVNSYMEPPAKISWDGKNAWQLVKDQIEKSNNEQQVRRLQDSLRFLRLMVLTNLLEEGSKLKYDSLMKPKDKNYGVHIISQTDSSGDTIKIYIKDTDYTLMGGEFDLQSAGGSQEGDDGNHFQVFFDKIEYEVDGLVFPRETRLYHRKKKIMEANLKLAQINALGNANTFFSNLNENPKIQKATRDGKVRRND